MLHGTKYLLTSTQFEADANHKPRSADGFLQIIKLLLLNFDMLQRSPTISSFAGFDVRVTQHLCQTYVLTFLNSKFLKPLGNRSVTSHYLRSSFLQGYYTTKGSLL